MIERPVENPVTVTEQLPPDREQEEAENVTLPEPLSDQLTVPVGLEPTTVAVHVLTEPNVTFEEPAVTLDGEQLTEVDVDIGGGGGGATIVRRYVPLLTALLMSPL
jgi:hypothetical protein